MDGLISLTNTVISKCYFNLLKHMYLHVVLDVVYPALKLSLGSIHIGDHGGNVSHDGCKDQDPD